MQIPAERDANGGFAEPVEPMPHFHIPIFQGGAGPEHEKSDIPPQGRRFQTRTSAPFPGPDVVGPPPFSDMGGEAVYVGSAIFENPQSVHPCKLVPSIHPPARVPYGGQEYGHEGRYDLLPIDNSLMEWVVADQGHIPEGRRPVDGGFEASGERLYHAVGLVQGISVPGKTAPHLRGANVAFGEEEHVITDNYWILCWKN